MHLNQNVLSEKVITHTQKYGVNKIWVIHVEESSYVKSIFITGTDTGVGKTYFTVSLIQQLNNEGYKTFGLKPIATGCHYDGGGSLVNSDALAIQKVASIKKEYKVVNPIVYQKPIAPHIAAKEVGEELSVKTLINIINRSIQKEADFNIIEGVGGWAVPLNDEELMTDVVSALNIPVILVVGIRLGCINHAILTYEAIKKSNVRLLGWVANCLDNMMLNISENVVAIKNLIPEPCISIVPYSEKTDL